MAENQMLVALRRITNVSSAVQDGNRFTVTLQNGDRLIVTYQEIAGTDHPHGITFEYILTSSDTETSTANRTMYECTIRSRQLQSGIDFQITAFNQYVTILKSI